MQAFILLSCEIAAENEVLQAIKKIDGVREATMTYGGYDIVAKIETESGKKMEDIIVKQVRRLQRVRSTVTLNVTD